MTNGNSERLGKASGLPRRLLAVLVGLLASLALIVSGTAPASAQNAVGPQPVHSILAVGPHAAAAPESVGVRGPPLRPIVSGTGVAADTGEGAAGGGALVKSEYPANGGFLGDPVDTTLKPGTVVDRYGYSGGSYVSPKGTPFGERGLPAYYESTKPYSQYEVVQPVTVRGGTVAPAFGGGGGGIQYQFGTSVQDLVDSGVLKPVGP